MIARDAMAFIQVGDGRLRLCMTPGGPVREVEWEFAFVSAVRWCTEREAVLVTATPPGGRKPSVDEDDRGDLSFYTWAPDEGGWRLVYRGYAHDPVCLAGDGWAVNRGAGLTYLDGAGRKTSEVKAGRFSWGPPSLSTRPSGDIVAWIRWRGDDRRLFLDDRSGQISSDQHTSVYRYAWADNETIVYYLGAGLRLLDIRTGKSRRLAPSLRALVGGAPDLPDRAADTSRCRKRSFMLNPVRSKWSTDACGSTWRSSQSARACRDISACSPETSPPVPSS